jgi:oligopeptide transport system substrate-binding protein
MDMLMEAERILVEEDAGTAPVYFEGEAHLVRPSLKGYYDHKYGATWSLQDWKLTG